MLNPSDALDAFEIGGIQGILFDIDETLVDLKTASIAGFKQMVHADFAGLGGQEIDLIARDFANDRVGAYDRYMAGELTFLGQRVLRLTYAYEQAGLKPPRHEEFEAWADAYELKVRAGWKPFPDVLPFLNQLDELAIPYGAVSNNVEEYQRGKLVAAGIPGFEVVVGSDTAGAPKPDKAPFISGCLALGTEPAKTLYIGDNPLTDYQGAVDAGLQSLLLDRGSTHRNFAGHRIENFNQFASFYVENPGFFAELA
ncbi:hydrolase [Glutamicibacter uratoxydans]|uniref:Hydrolase n=1 Tax=Glutamicibacter uratoxydans TaxID=43667 RepID=A0A4Y4DMB6_GLUUR|nr:HAD family hydrolase [Glutamicibacter uratoxydans]GED05743.1 hydrolase [Glutamicibacter uratoxydans]